MAGKLRKSSPITQSGNRSVEGSKILLKKGRQEGCSGGATILAVQVVGEGGGLQGPSHSRKTPKDEKSGTECIAAGSTIHNTKRHNTIAGADDCLARR